MEIDIIGQAIIDEIKKNLINRDKISSGRLLKSLSYNTIQTIEGWTIQILAEKYLQFVDQGRKPGKRPPFKDIEKWVIEKPINIPGQTTKQTAFIIAKSIGENGIVATNIVEKSIQKVLDNLEEIISIEKLYSI